MKNVNSFWKAERKSKLKVCGNSMTVPGMGTTIQDFINKGNIDEVSKQIKKKMIYGTKIKIEDLTKIDYFKDKLKRFENLTRSHAQDQLNAIKEQTNVKENKPKSVKTEIPSNEEIKFESK